MEKKIVVSKRFRNNSLRIYQYLQLRFSSKTAFLFLDKLEERITFIINHPEAGKVSEKRVLIPPVPLGDQREIQLQAP